MIYLDKTKITLKTDRHGRKLSQYYHPYFVNCFTCQKKLIVYARYGPPEVWLKLKCFTCQTSFKNKLKEFFMEKNYWHNKFFVSAFIPLICLVLAAIMILLAVFLNLK